MLISLWPALAFAQLPESRVLTLDLAQDLAREAMAVCKANGYSVTVLVVDGMNAPKVLLRADGAPPATTEIGKMKATATMLFNQPSGFEGASGAYPLPALIPGTINSAGAIPIRFKGVTIGALAVSGAPGGDKDAACANAALKKFSARLK